VVVVLVFIMGMRMGSDQQVISSITSIGVISVLMTVVLWIGTFLAIWLVRKMIRMDRYGNRLGPGTASQEPMTESLSVDVEEGEQESDLMTILILAGTVAGILVGYFWIRTHLDEDAHMRFEDISSNLMMAVLCLLVLVIGYVLGLEGKIFREFRKAGFRILLFPVVIVVATGVLAIGMGILLPQVSLRESLAISFGYGWYTFAPGIITAAGHNIAGAISFLHNVLRELVGIVIMPVVAKRIGYIECVSVPGIACMDVGLPIIAKVTRSEMLVYAFALGLVEELVTTVVIPLVIGA
jgi:uncharacterized membrane protein YbjE (DUF340 family)